MTLDQPIANYQVHLSTAEPVKQVNMPLTELMALLTPATAGYARAANDTEPMPASPLFDLMAVSKVIADEVERRVAAAIADLPPPAPPAPVLLPPDLSRPLAETAARLAELEQRVIAREHEAARVAAVEDFSAGSDDDMPAFMRRHQSTAKVAPVAPTELLQQRLDAMAEQIAGLEQYLARPPVDGAARVAIDAARVELRQHASQIANLADAQTAPNPDPRIGHDIANLKAEMAAVVERLRSLEPRDVDPTTGPQQPPRDDAIHKIRAAGRDRRQRAAIGGDIDPVLGIKLTEVAWLAKQGQPGPLSLMTTLGEAGKSDWETTADRCIARADALARVSVVSYALEVAALAEINRLPESEAAAIADRTITTINAIEG